MLVCTCVTFSVQSYCLKANNSLQTSSLYQNYSSFVQLDSTLMIVKDVTIEGKTVRREGKHKNCLSVCEAKTEYETVAGWDASHFPVASAYFQTLPHM